MGSSADIVKKYSGIRFEGEAQFEDASGRSLRQKFVCSTLEHRKRLMHDEELPKTLRDLQDVPEQLGKIVNVLNEMRRDQQRSESPDLGSEEIPEHSESDHLQS